MTTEKKSTLRASQRGTLGLKKTTETSKVKQSFARGRTNTVLVEVKKTRRPVKEKPDEKPVVQESTSEAPPPPPKEKPKAPPPPSQEKKDMDGRLARQEKADALLRKAEEERYQAMVEASRREEEERTEKNKSEKTAKPKPTSKTKSHARKTVKAEAPPAILEDPVKAHGAGKRSEDEIKDEDKSAGARRKAEAPKSIRPRGEKRRQSGKLTVARALADEDDQIRVRSMAALKRAREKEKRALKTGQAPVQKQSREVTVPESITVQELANRMAERAADLVKTLFNMGVAVTVNQTIDQDTAELVLNEFGHKIKRIAESDVEIGLSGEEDSEDQLSHRAPVVTIMGHVDHGKTSLLDALRKSDIVAAEAGGITQHIGAYQIMVREGAQITFLDTPGHEAFTEMRSRGAHVTDIVVLVIAADDGPMPQTIEAINHARAAKVPIIVAITKTDLPGSNPDKIREDLLQHEVIVEKLSGDVQDVEISTPNRVGLDTLLDKILLQAEMMEIKANPSRSAEGTVIEARLDKGRGPVATILVQRGTLQVGDIFVVGSEWGKVRALKNDHAETVKSAGPAQPVEVLGLSGVPEAGDIFSVVENEARAREVATYRQSLAKNKRTTMAPASLENLFSNLKADKAKEFPVVIKADVHGSVEAIHQAVTKIGSEDIKVQVLHAAVGGITESDISLAKASNALVIGFNVRANAKAREAAERDGVTLNYYDIIYDLIDDLKKIMAGDLGPEIVENVVGTARVQDIFQAGKSGRAAGCMVTEGTLKRNLKARIMRDDVIVYVGALSSLRRFKDDVAEVRNGQECGLTLENYNDIKQGDIIEVFEQSERERQL